MPSVMLAFLLSICAFSLLLEASSPAPPIGLSTATSLLLASNTRFSASSVISRQNFSSTYNASAHSPQSVSTNMGSSALLHSTTSQTATLTRKSSPSPTTPLSTSSLESSSIQSLPSISEGSVVTETISGIVVSETFMPTTYTQYISLTTPLSTFTTDAQSRTVPLIIGSGGVGWRLPSVPGTVPEIGPPTVLPSQLASVSMSSSATITQRPSSTHTLSGTELTSTSIENVSKNTKTITSEGGHKTVLPIVFCPTCGSRGTSWIIHPPDIHPPGGIEFHISGVKWPFTINSDSDAEPVDLSDPEPEPDDSTQSKSNPSKSQDTTNDSTASQSSLKSSSASTKGPSSASSSGNSTRLSTASRTVSSSSASSRTGTVTVATSIDVDPYATEIPQDQIAEVQSYLSSLFAAELDQIGTTLESMTKPASSTSLSSASGTPIPSATSKPSTPPSSPSTTSGPPAPSSTVLAPPPGETVTMSDGDVCFLPDGSTDPDCNDAGTPDKKTSATSPAPTPAASAPPATATCKCNEDGCTDDSPACCANGSCPASVAAVP